MERSVTIRTNDLTKVYDGTMAVDRLNLEVEAGEIFGLLGPNGAGKTTTILMLLGLTDPSDGSVEILGMDPTRSPLEVKSQVGYLPDAVGFYDDMTGRQNLRYTADLNGLSKRDAEDTIDGLLERVGLTDVRDHRVETYSRGMLQRLGVADALVKGPRILILDEPTASIDPEGVADMLRLIRELAETEGVTLLLSSHLLGQVEEVCDRVAIFVKGKVVAHGTTSELAASGDGPETVRVGTDLPADEVRTALSTERWVLQLEQDRLSRWLVTVDRGRTTRLVETLTAAGGPPWLVARESDRLDEVYHRYFAQEARHGS